MSIKSVALRYPLGDRYALDLLAGCKLDNLILIGDFDGTSKSVMPHLEGLRVRSIKIGSRHQPMLIPLSLRFFPGHFQSSSLGWNEYSRPSPSRESFKKLITGPESTRTRAQTKRATESRYCKVRIKTSHHLN
jgi:hypothetical protein